ncbi:hypothetical protein C8Q80DRAFT_1098350 [Daedaleopsis nitida]|nr:hypothetical protein C8Q80DRAFT_1098350 [Daedaleopsis nitida]
MLLDSLADGSLQLSQAHLIVVSDVQRVVPMVAPHPVLRIMLEHHNKLVDAPSVLAMFTSSPHRWPSLDFTWLESSLRARAFFLMTKAVDTWSGPMELVIEYDAYDPPRAEHELFEKIHEIDPRGAIFRPHHYRRASRILRQLGSFAAGLYWKEGIDTVLNTPDGPESNTTDIRRSLEALKKQFPEDKLDVRAGSASYNATPKLDKVLQVLKLVANNGTDFRGVVYVQDRAVAHILSEVLNNELPFIQAATLCGVAWRKPDEGVSWLTSLELLQDFEAGSHNVLISTKSCEDLDIAPVSMIINFDLFDDQLTHAYSHAHSKGQLSHTVYLVERDNNEHRRILARLQTLDDELRSWIADLAQDDENVPPRTMYTSIDPYRSDGEEDDQDEEYIEDPTTGARLYKSDVVAAVYKFVAEIQATPGFGEQTPSLSLEKTGGNGNGQRETFRYTLTFPVVMRLPTFVGPYSPSRWEAKRDTCYQACHELVQVGLMNLRHFPQSRIPAPRATSTPSKIQTANASAKTHGYPRKTTDFWRNSQSSPSTTLYPTIVVPEDLGGDPHAPVLLLTRAALPLTVEFNVFFCGARASVRFYKAEPLEVNDGQLKALHGYTLRVTKSLTNKPLDCPVGSLLCYFAPLEPTWHSSLSARWPLLSVQDHIQWGSVQLAADYFAIPLLDGNTSIDERARDAIVLDRQVEFTMRHFVRKVRHDMTPLSKAEDSPREADYASFLEYCKARLNNFQGIEDEKQPMIEVSAVPGVINNLHPTSAPPTPPAKSPLKYLIPELCHKFTIPASVFRTLWLMPSILNKIESYLLTKELNARLFHNMIIEQQLLIALSAPAAWTEANYERLEFLGDSFLKVVGSNYCYVTMPSVEVGELHVARQGIIGNKVLQGGAAGVGVPSYIQHKRFVAKIWQPPIASGDSPDRTRVADADGDIEMADAAQENKDKGKRSKKQRQLDDLYTLWMGDKTIADVVEAILAAAFLSGGHEVALQAARCMQIPIPGIAQWADYTRLATEHAVPPQTGAILHPSPSTVAAVERIFGASFARPELLEQALVHTSKSGGNQVTSYERLEFIGDAVLDFLVARYIWERYPFLSPGGLTLLKAAMVSNQTLAAFSVHLGLHHQLQVDAKDLTSTIEKYADFLEELRKKEYDFAAREQRLPGQYWLDMPMEPPKCLSDVVESVLGALYISDNFFEVGVGQFFEGIFKPFLEAHIRLQTLSTNPKVTLLEFLAAEGCQNHTYMKEPNARSNMPVNMTVIIHGKVIAAATDSSPVIATRKVSLAALDALANDPELLARTCDCKSASNKQTPAKKPAVRVETQEDEETDAAEVEAAMEGVEEDAE